MSITGEVYDYAVAKVEQARRCDDDVGVLAVANRLLKHAEARFAEAEEGSERFFTPLEEAANNIRLFLDSRQHQQEEEWDEEEDEEEDEDLPQPKKKRSKKATAPPRTHVPLRVAMAVSFCFCCGYSCG